MSNVPPSSPRSEPAGNDADLLASLYVDDEATAEERAQVEADPELLALVESIRTTAMATAHVVPPDGLRAIQIGAALDLFDEQHRTVAPAPVSSLSERRTRRARHAGLPSWLGAAAVAALIVGGLGFVVTSSRGGNDDEAASLDTAPAASSTNRDADASAVAETESAEMATEAGTEEEATEEAMEEVAGDAAADDGAAESPTTTVEQNPATFYAERGPINLADYEGATALDYAEQLTGAFPVQPIAESPCADSPLVDGLFGVDSFYPVIYKGRLASLIVQDGALGTALIVGPTCEVEQD
jgi:hypothetical protein